MDEAAGANGTVPAQAVAAGAERQHHITLVGLIHGAQGTWVAPGDGAAALLRVGGEIKSVPQDITVALGLCFLSRSCSVVLQPGLPAFYSSLVNGPRKKKAIILVRKHFG